MVIKAYRFRGVENPEYTTDILENGRLYCANWRDLNDPMEGTYDTLKVDPEKRSAAIRSIYDEKVRLRVCSLSRTYKSHAMWAYYASGFHGAVIELELDEGDLRPVDYCSGQRVQSWAERSYPYDIAQSILTKKHSDWEREQELRLLHPGMYFPLKPGSVRRVILGSRCLPEFVERLRTAAGTVPVQTLEIRSGELHAA